MSDVTVIGAGAWGTALAIQAARAGATVRLWARDPARAAAIDAQRESPRLPGVRLTEQVTVIHDLARVAGIVLVAVPMQHQRAVLARLPPGTAPLVVCAKGIETGTILLPLEVVDGGASRRRSRRAHRPELRPRDRRRPASRRSGRRRSGRLARPGHRRARPRRPSGSTATTTRSAPRWAARPRTSSLSPPAP